ncbi:hypothetical protein AAMO2058_000528400 [Amorphochlora amoebiformis]
MAARASQVCIEFPSGSFSLGLPEDLGLSDLQNQIEARTGIPIAQQRLQLKGQWSQLPRSTKLRELNNATVVISLRLCGGGGDGGSIPGRRDLVRTAETHGWWVHRLAKLDPELATGAFWTMCTLTEEKLRDPIVADQLGRLYNKEAILGYILKKEIKGHFSHIKSKRDYVQVKPTISKSRSSEVGDHPLGWVCPVTGKPANGKRPFFLIWGCGCLVSKEAIDQLGRKNCPRCARELDKEYDEFVPMTPKEEEIKGQYAKMIIRNKVLNERAKAEKARRKSEKLKKKAAKAAARAARGGGTEVEKGTEKVTKKKKKDKVKTVLEQKKAEKKRPKRLLTEVEREIQANLKKAKKASKVFSSMFLTKEDFKNDERYTQLGFISTKPRSQNGLV